MILEVPSITLFNPETKKYLCGNYAQDRLSSFSSGDITQVPIEYLKPALIQANLYVFLHTYRIIYLILSLD